MKFNSLDKQYKTVRTELSAKYGNRELWSVIDHWPIYCGISNLARYLSIYELFKETLSVPGHVAEFGSWRGANLMFMTKVLKILDPYGCKVVHCFDSFEGLTNFSRKDGTTANQLDGQYKGSLEELEDFIKLYELQDDIDIHQGYVEEVLPALIGDRQELTFSFVYCDVDLYDGTKVILEQLHPRLSKGGVFLLDEWNYEIFPGETKAVREFLSEYGDSYDVEHVHGTRQPSLVLRKVKH